MSDEEVQMLRRRAQEGDARAEERLGRMESRGGESVFSFMEGLVGKLLFIEGLRINYRGILKRVIKAPNGDPAALVFDRLQRVSWFQKEGPEAAYSFVHERERLVPWDSILDVGEESFTGSRWVRP
jgi:hypothetical protein